jgi:ribose-phosphate pyrophosphokinase
VLSWVDLYWRHAMKDELKLFCGNSNHPLAERISAYLERPLSRAKVSRFSDGEISVKIEENVRGRDIFIIQSTHAPAENLLELLILLDAAKRASARRVTAVIPYFGYARQDRKDQPRVPITAKLVADLLSVSGANRVLTMDLHAAQIQGFFNIPLDHLFAAPVFIRHIKRRKLSNPVLVAPDPGSIPMTRHFAKTLKTSLAFIDKRRPEQDQIEVMNIIGEVAGKNVVIQDDMINTASTLAKGAKALSEMGAREIYAYCTHPVLSGPAIENVADSPITKVVVTDTIPLREEAVNGKFEVVSVAELFGEAIRRIHREESVTSLFD